MNVNSKHRKTYRDLYTVSNEIIGKEAILTVHEGTVHRIRNLT